MRNASALTSDDFSEHLFNGLADEAHILVAVSGGSDSIALLYLLNDWAKAPNRPELTVATIDHGLRDEAASEALQVGLIAKKLGLAHISKCWHGRKPESGISQKAREARYALLSEIACEVGASTIALGHNLDDQRETVLMRAERSGYSDFEYLHDGFSNIGLSGIRPKSTYCGPPNFIPVGIARPLLKIGRAELRSYLDKIGVGWIDDPSNLDDHYERVRLRKALEVHPENFPSAKKVSNFADQVAMSREVLAQNCADFINENVCWQRHLDFTDGVLLIKRDAFISADRLLKQYVLRVVIGVIGGRSFYVSPDKAALIAEDICAGIFKRCSLGSAILDLKKEHIHIWRENRNIPLIEMNKASGDVVGWDGRIIYRFSDVQARQGLILRALGADGLKQIVDDLGGVLSSSQGTLKPLSTKSMVTQPALFFEDRLLFAPLLPWKAAEFCPPEIQYWSPSIELFLPECDFSLSWEITQLRYRADKQANIA